MFNDTFGNFVIYVDEIATDQVALRNVFVSDERKPEEQRFITAREGRLLSDEVNRRVTLRLLDGAIHETSPSALQKYREVRFRLYDITLVLENPLLKQGGTPKGDREMSLAELRTATQNAINLKGNPNPYLVEIHKKFAIPAACLVFSVLGVPLGIRAHRGGRWGSFVALLPIVLFYYFGLTLGENIGDYGRIPPWLAMWAPNIIVGDPCPLPAARQPQGATDSPGGADPAWVLGDRRGEPGEPTARPTGYGVRQSRCDRTSGGEPAWVGGHRPPA